MLKLLLVKSERLEITDDETLALAVLVMDVEFSDALMTEDGVVNAVLLMDEASVVLSTDDVAFLDNKTVELFTTNVSVNSVADGEIRVVELLMLTLLEE